MDADLKRYAAELIGTFVLVLGGVGSAVMAGDQIGPHGVAIAFGLSLLVMVYVIGPVSGCHINPAVTLGLLLHRKIDSRPAAFYVVAQVIGAILAAGLIYLIANDVPGGYDLEASGLGANGYDDHSPGGFGMLAALLAEVFLTALLVFTVLGATARIAPVGFAGLAIGLVLTVIHLVGIPITNTSVNPARSIGPAVFVGDWALSQLWLFIVAPLAGAVLGAIAYRAIELEEAPPTAAEAERALPSEQAERPPSTTRRAERRANRRR